MINKVKARALIGLGELAIATFIILIGYTIGAQSVTRQTHHQIKTEAHKLLTKEKQAKESRILSDKLVKEFLTQYFTKSKLGENNARIKPYMTESAYSEELAHQEETINQVYKDYRLDYRFD